MRTANTSFFVVVFSLSIISTSTCIAEDKPDEILTYKTIGDVKLQLHIFNPSGWQPPSLRGGWRNQPKPCIVFFFGGGWVGGSPSQFYPHCRYLASRGMVAISAEYRIRSKHKTTPYECVRDGKSAVRWIRKNARKLGVDPNRLAAGGGSAGGHVAAATAEKYKELMKKVGVRCDLHLYKDQPHGFFNYRKGKNPYYNQTVIAADKFLASLGYLKGNPTMKNKPLQ